MNPHLTNFTFITGNENKARYVAEWLGKDVPHHKVDLDEIQTLDLHELVTHKVKQAYHILQTPVLVEDAQLSFTAMGNLPGPFIRWFIDEIGYDGICQMLNAFDDRTAHGRICYALYDGKDMQFFDGDMHGHITKTPRGTGGFGFDAIFVNDGYSETRAEMSEEDYVKTSYRKTALDKLKAYLSNE
jgi:non-canonical purine NTP pyrophosphatase (RdgB/HAM1 family)